jgi:peptide/nickel transport system permease protein
VAIVFGFVVLALGAAWIAPLDPIATSWGALRKAPSAAHWFGTDEIGRDVLSRVIWGTRASLLAGVVSVSISLLLGVPIGLAAGFMGGAVDTVISRITDAFLACPFLILAIALAAFLGPSLSNAMIAIGVSATPIFVRLTRAQVINVKVEDYIEAARAVGNPPWRIGHAGDCRRRDCRGQPVLFGPGPAAASAQLGQHAQHRQKLCRQRALDGHLARAVDLSAGAGLQPGGRRAA